MPRARCAIFSSSAMSRNFVIVAAFIIIAASVAGGVRSRASRRHAVTNTNASAQSEQFEADRIEADYSEAISTITEQYAGEVDYEKATQAAIVSRQSTSRLSARAKKFQSLLRSPAMQCRFLQFVMPS